MIRYFYTIHLELPVNSKNCVDLAYFPTCSAPVRASDCIALFEEANCAFDETRCKSQNVFASSTIQFTARSVACHCARALGAPIRCNLDDVFTSSRLSPCAPSRARHYYLWHTVLVSPCVVRAVEMGFKNLYFRFLQKN